MESIKTREPKSASSRPTSPAPEAQKKQLPPPPYAPSSSADMREQAGMGIASGSGSQRNRIGLSLLRPIINRIQAKKQLKIDQATRERASAAAQERAFAASRERHDNEAKEAAIAKQATQDAKVEVLKPKVAEAIDLLENRKFEDAKELIRDITMESSVGEVPAWRILTGDKMKFFDTILQNGDDELVRRAIGMPQIRFTELEAVKVTSRILARQKTDQLERLTAHVIPLLLKDLQDKKGASLSLFSAQTLLKTEFLNHDLEVASIGVFRHSF